MGELDERRLERLLHDAAGEVPAPSFTVDDVRSASRRITARRRSLATVAAAVVVGAGAVTGVVLGGPEQGGDHTTALAPAESTASDGAVKKSSEGGQPTGDGPRGQGVENFPDGPPKQGGESHGEDGPRAEGTPGCQAVDRELATALAGELPVDPIGEATRYGPCSEVVSRSAAFRVPGGVVAVVLHPDRESVVPAPPDVASHVVDTVVGEGRLTVLGIAENSADETDVPLRDELPGIADRVAAALG
ncbi:hypothetical protein ACWGPQ_14425 [Saccharomonospora azurea]|uniref:Uncharacterized protein n=1 Tax=Saccharomonospora azurea NA-128 TaxID=882081 RepID=H8G8Y1_9PSEU|nr:hypothetical protein [Saccharomonospora azurea]EHY89497.1 hypothetical protein SacazDRAFT_02603 [Saccharomonospora azurea NA-128]